MASLNKAILIGNVGQDPEVRYSQSGAPIARFTLATNERFKNRSGELQERTEWHSVVAFGQLAERIKEYVGKGKQIYVEGRIQSSSWTDANGIKHTRTEIMAQQVLFLGQRGTGGAGAGSGGDYPQAARKQPPAQGGGSDREVIDLGVDDDFSVNDLGPAVEMDDFSLTPGG
jgi:single-strand DNA-binding protein